MVESALINTILGCLVGSVAGLIPGTGLLVSLMVMYPYLINLDLIGLICFYIGLANLAQFTGSVTAIHFGLPGEANSVPAVIEGHALAKQGKGHTAIIGTSLSSFCAGILTLLFLVCLFPIYDDIFQWFYKTTNQLIVFSFALLVFWFASKNKWYYTFLFMCFGYLIGKIGFNEFTGSYFLSFGDINLQTGVPIFPVIIGVLVIPHIFTQYNFAIAKRVKTNYKSDILLFIKNFKFSMLGTSIGCICGLVPGVSTVLATNLSHRVSKSIDRNKGPSYRSLISVEASNNSAILVTLLPLLILGIPITGSEALLLSIVEMNLLEINWRVILDLHIHYIIAISVFLSMFIGLMVSWPLSGYLHKFLSYSKDYVKFVIIFVLLFSVFFVASLSGQYFYYFLCLTIASVFGWCFRQYDLLPFIFIFLIQKKLESIIVVSYNILT